MPFELKVKLVAEIYIKSGERFHFHEDEKDNLRTLFSCPGPFRHKLYSLTQKDEDLCEETRYDILVRKDDHADSFEVHMENVIIRYPDTPEAEEGILRTFFDRDWVL